MFFNNFAKSQDNSLYETDGRVKRKFRNRHKKSVS